MEGNQDLVLSWSLITRRMRQGVTLEGAQRRETRKQRDTGEHKGTRGCHTFDNTQALMIYSILLHILPAGDELNELHLVGAVTRLRPLAGWKIP